MRFFAVAFALFAAAATAIPTVQQQQQDEHGHSQPHSDGLLSIVQVLLQHQQQQLLQQQSPRLPDAVPTNPKDPSKPHRLPVLAQSFSASFNMTFFGDNGVSVHPGSLWANYGPQIKGDQQCGGSAEYGSNFTSEIRSVLGFFAFPDVVARYERTVTENGMGRVQLWQVAAGNESCVSTAEFASWPLCLTLETWTSLGRVQVDGVWTQEYFFPIPGYVINAFVNDFMDPATVVRISIFDADSEQRRPARQQPSRSTVTPTVLTSVDDSVEAGSSRSKQRDPGLGNQMSLLEKVRFVFFDISTGPPPAAAFKLPSICPHTVGPS